MYFICCRLTDLQQQTLVFIFKNTVLKGLVRPMHLQASNVVQLNSPPKCPAGEYLFKGATLDLLIYVHWYIHSF